MNSRPGSAAPLASSGIACPSCGASKSRVTCTLRLAGIVLRHRKCRKCKTSWKTQER